MHVGASATPLALVAVALVLPPTLIGMLAICSRRCRTLQRSLLRGRHLSRLLIAAMLVVLWSGYYTFWSRVLPYWHASNTVEWYLHSAFASWVLLNLLWNYAFTICIDPTSAPAAGGEVRHCVQCDRQVSQLDHHCIFTGSCVGGHNYNFFCLGLVDALVGSSYACVLSWQPHRSCTRLFDSAIEPYLGEAEVAQAVRACAAVLGPPPAEDAYLPTIDFFLTAAACLVCVALLAFFHLLLALNSLTTLCFNRDWKARGAASLRDLVLMRGARMTTAGTIHHDKWAMLWGGRHCGPLQRLRVVLLPSLPPRPSHAANHRCMKKRQAWN